MTGNTAFPCQDRWHGKPYYSLDAYCKNTYGEKLYKIALNAGMTCPNRDGAVDTRGCIFCSAGGSGDFAVQSGAGMTAQLEKGRSLFGAKKTGGRFIAYFQAYTNTYAPLAYLESVFTQALRHPLVAGISIATRPDCLGADVLSLLSRLREDFSGKFIWLELGLQTIHEKTALYIRRGYPLSVFDDAVRALQERLFPVIVHIILGLPGETDEMMYQTVSYLNRFPADGVKLQLLHILKGTDLEQDYAAGKFETLSEERYLRLLIGSLERLSPQTVIHRLTGDGPRSLLTAPLYSLDKRRILNTLHRRMKILGSRQGTYFIQNLEEQL